MRKRRSEEHTSELQSRSDLVCRLLLEKKNNLIVASGPTTSVPPARVATGHSVLPARAPPERIVPAQAAPDRDPGFAPGIAGQHPSAPRSLAAPARLPGPRRR